MNLWVAMVTNKQMGVVQWVSMATNADGGGPVSVHGNKQVSMATNKGTAAGKQEGKKATIKQKHIAKDVLNNCWEYSNYKGRGYGWNINQ